MHLKQLNASISGNDNFTENNYNICINSLNVIGWVVDSGNCNNNTAILTSFDAHRTRHRTARAVPATDD